MVAGLDNYCGVEVRFPPLTMKVQNFILALFWRYCAITLFGYLHVRGWAESAYLFFLRCPFQGHSEYLLDFMFAFLNFMYKVYLHMQLLYETLAERQLAYT
jgi:hypothetical protein